MQKIAHRDLVEIDCILSKYALSYNYCYINIQNAIIIISYHYCNINIHNTCCEYLYYNNYIRHICSVCSKFQPNLCEPFFCKRYLNSHLCQMKIKEAKNVWYSVVCKFRKQHYTCFKPCRIWIEEIQVNEIMEPLWSSYRIIQHRCNKSPYLKW